MLFALNAYRFRMINKNKPNPNSKYILFEEVQYYNKCIGICCLKRSEKAPRNCCRDKEINVGFLLRDRVRSDTCTDGFSIC